VTLKAENAWNDKPEFKWEPEGILGGGMSAMALLWPSKEPYWHVPKDMLKQFGSNCLIKPPVQPRPEHLLYTSDKSKCSHSLIPTSVMVGNSFTLLLYDNYNERFENLYRIHDLSHFHHLGELIPDGTKYLIWQFFELQIAYQLMDPNWWAWLDTAYPHSLPVLADH
jgi:hypothetical protein